MSSVGHPAHLLEDSSEWERKVFAKQLDFLERETSEWDCLYAWEEGFHTGVRPGSEANLCRPVMVGSRLDGTKELLALDDDRQDSEVP